MSSKRRPAHSGRDGRRPSLWRWAGFLVVPVLLTALVAISSFTERDGTVVDEATAFALPATDGRTVALQDALASGDTLLYFSMGVGCDGCFAQIPELESGLAERGVNLVPVMVDPAPLVAAEAARFGIDRPILIDGDAAVSRAYGMVGIYGHGDRPSHSFALVRRSGDVAWVRHYAEMFVPAAAFLAELDEALDA